jgi:hypothetical protein
MSRPWRSFAAAILMVVAFASSVFPCLCTADMAAAASHCGMSGRGESADAADVRAAYQCCCDSEPSSPMEVAPTASVAAAPFFAVPTQPSAGASFVSGPPAWLRVSPLIDRTPTVLRI